MPVRGAAEESSSARAAAGESSGVSSPQSSPPYGPNSPSYSPISPSFELDSQKGKQEIAEESSWTRAAAWESMSAREAAITAEESSGVSSPQSSPQYGPNSPCYRPPSPFWERDSQEEEQETAGDLKAEQPAQTRPGRRRMSMRAIELIPSLGRSRRRYGESAPESAGPKRIRLSRVSKLCLMR